MNFVVPAALAIALLVGLPIAAHLLRRGRVPVKEFPPARWVNPQTTKVHHRRRRLRDRPLLIVRCFALLALAAMGAAPLVRCSGLALGREEGKAIALAIVLDDSQSMRAVVGEGESRWERAKAAARQLLDGAESGDAVSIVLAGAPARVRLAATSDLEAARETLDELEPTDRATALAESVRLARALLASLPQQDRRVVVLSDFAASEPAMARETTLGGTPEGGAEDEPGLESGIKTEAPLEILRDVAPNCGVVTAREFGPDISVRVACNIPEAAEGRSLELLGGATPQRLGELESRAGVQTLRGHAPRAANAADDHVVLRTRISGGDAIAVDDTAVVADEALTGAVGVVSATTPPTGGRSLIEQALAALGEPGRDLRNLPTAPEAEADLRGYDVLILDDPQGLSPESTEAIGEWVRTGGVALALFGPQSNQAPLGASLRPFSTAPIRWEEFPSTNEAVPKLTSLDWGGLDPRDLADLSATGRAHLAPDPEAIKGRWSDGSPFLSVVESGRGLLVATSLPSSPEFSDFSLRPGFLALLRAALDAAKERRGDRETGVGVPWVVAGTEAPTVVGPDGPLEAVAAGAVTGCVGDCADVELWEITPELAGRYEFESGNGSQVRIARLSDVELLTMPSNEHQQSSAESSSLGAQRTLDLSNWVALVLVGLLGVEIVLRLLRLVNDRRESAVSERRTEL